MFLVDSHCHLDSLDYQDIHKDIDDVISKAKEMDVTHFLAPGVDLESFEYLYDLVKHRDEVWCACAIHPENITENNMNFSADKMKEYLSRDKVIALGEAGLDYVCVPETKDIQKKVFARQVAIASELNKPIIVHARGATLDCIDIIKSEGGVDVGGVMHCFCDDVDIARKCLDMGYYISFSGIVTFKNAVNVRDACNFVPLDRMLVETDCPYLAPVPKRGKPNEPAYVSYTAKFIGDFKGVSYEEVCNTTSTNFCDLFKVTL